jgi:magnesium-transporting ATPase (P-type)
LANEEVATARRATILLISVTYRQPIGDVIAALGTNVQHGLSDSEAQSRLQQHGHNELVAEKPLPAWRRFLAQFQDVLVILLLVATAISAGLWASERDAALPYEAIASTSTLKAPKRGLHQRPIQTR